MAAFLALPVREFPFVDDKYELNYAVKWTGKPALIAIYFEECQADESVTITVALAIPFITLAIFVNRILQILKWIGGRLRLLCTAIKLVAKGSHLALVVSWTALAYISRHLFSVLKLLASCIALCFIVVFKLKDFEKAKKEAQGRDEVLTKRRFVFRRLLRKAAENRDRQDEERGSRWSLGSSLSSVHEFDNPGSTGPIPSQR